MSDRESAYNVRWDAERSRWIIAGRWGFLTACPCCDKPFPSRETAQLCADNLGIIDAAATRKPSDE